MRAETQTVRIERTTNVPAAGDGKNLLGCVVSHYRILARLGGGGMGVVYRAEDLRLERPVALKFLPPALTWDREARLRFIGEARTASALDHPNICTIHEIGESEDGTIFIAMPCYEGETLKSKLQRGPLGVTEARRIVDGIARGLAKAHREGIVHRDVKPANVFVTNDGQVKVLDFGLAKLADQTTVGQEPGLTGTIAYLAPEQIRGDPVDPRVDVWAFGVVLYETLTGRRPFTGHHANAVIYAILNEEPPPLRALVDEVPLHLEQMIGRLLRKDPDARYRSMEDILAHLELTERSGGLVAQGERSVAVLPFRNTSPEPEQEYFCDGMAEEIIAGLSQVPGLRVAARTSAFAFKGRSVDVREIGRRLGVEALLEGCVRKAGCHLRITVQLVDARRGFQIWSGRYDRQISDLFGIQEEIARNIVRALRVTLAPAEGKALVRQGTADVRAYDLYLRGREFLNQLTRRSLEHARRMFARASDIDPAFALACAGAADACSFLCMWFERSEELLREADAMSLRAIELDPGLAEGHAARGLALSMNRHHEEAAESFRIAAQLDPRLFEAHYFHARHCAARGRLAEAAELYRRANEVRPEDYQSLFLCSQALRGLGRHEEAREVGLAAIATADRHLELYPEDTRALYLGAAALVVYGQKERGLEWARLAAALDPEDEGMLYQLACIHALGGDVEQALDCLEQWEKRGALPREWLENDSDLDGLREHPRFRALMERL